MRTSRTLALAEIERSVWLTTVYTHSPTWHCSEAMAGIMARKCGIVPFGKHQCSSWRVVVSLVWGTDEHDQEVDMLIEAKDHA